MANLRTAIPDFQLANPIYVGATVTFYTVTLAGVKTATLATLYAGPTGSSTLQNPQTLDGDGKFAAPVYIDEPVIGEISGASVASHETAVIHTRGVYKGDYIEDEVYWSTDLVRDALTGDIYVVTNDYQSDTLANDIAGGDLVILVEIAPIAAVATAAAAAAAASAAAAAASASSASNAEFPAIPVALDYVRRNAGNTAYENRTPVQAAGDLEPLSADISSAATTDLSTMTGVSGNLTGNATISSLGTLAAGVERELTLTGTPTFTYHATNLILPRAVDFVGAAGDIVRFRSNGGGAWKMVSCLRASGQLPAGTLILKQSSNPTPTAEGDAQWDTDDDVLVIGNGSTQKIFIPAPASVAAGDLFYASAAKVLSRLAKGAAGQVLKMNSGATAPEWVGGAPDVVIEDRRSAGTNGGTYTSGSWATRTLNTEVRDPYSLASISSNQVTFTVAGWVEWEISYHRTGVTKSRLRNITDSTTAGVGMSLESDSDEDGCTISRGGCAVVASKAYEIQMQGANTQSNNGMGAPAGFSEIEVYARLSFWRG